MPVRRAVIAALAALATLAAAGCSSSAPASPIHAATATASASTSASVSASASATRTTVSPTTVAPTRTTAHRATPTIPPLSPAARRAGLVDIHSVVPDAIVDLRYATSDNFTHVRLYPRTARCLVHTSLRTGLRTAAARLRSQGYRLVFWDCYRPHAVQVRMFRIVPDPEFVARPQPSARSHEAGRSVDVTLAYAVRPAGACATTVHGHCLLAMGTDFDSFTARAHAHATDGVSRPARAHRVLLRQAMAAGGVTVYTGEWWHFDGPGADTGRPFLGAPLH